MTNDPRLAFRQQRGPAIAMELVRESRHWWHDLTELATFGRWLTDTGRGPRDPWEVVEKPWNWGDAHDEFLREEALERLADENEAFADDMRGAL